MKSSHETGATLSAVCESVCVCLGRVCVWEKEEKDGIVWALFGSFRAGLCVGFR